VEDTQRRAGTKRKRCVESDDTAAVLAHTTTVLLNTVLDAAEETVKSLGLAIDEAVVQQDFSKLRSLGIRIFKMRTLKDALIEAQKRSDVNTMVSVSHDIMQLQSE
jgi:phosphopantetheinyl transferase (holo-ACP synthase)